MFGYSKGKFWSVIVTIVIGIVFALPSFLPTAIYEKTPKDMRSWFKPITLGLDLQGGSYLLMEVDTKNLVSEKLEGLADLTRSALRSEKVRFSGLKVENDALTLKVLKAEDLNTVRDTIRKQEAGIPLQIDTEGTNVTIHYTEDALNIMKRQAVAQSLEIVRKRIDELGTKEPQIQQQGADRIVIQLPGVQDPSEIKALMGKTAKLTFHLVDESTNVIMARQGKISPDSMLMDGNETGPIVLKRAVVVGGESLEDARTTYDEKGEAAVSFSFKSIGAKKFANATRENVGRRLAIVLDGKVISAPTINTPITGGKGIITGKFSVAAANDLALLLRSGALPAPLIVQEERVVGPGLGDDSIRAGTTACVLGLLFVFVFMIIVYGRYGIFADIALLTNGILLLALLSIFDATLTLPGLAGIALTIAMAVDSNILVFERMKEEIQKGVSHPMEILNRGFQGAFSAILDGQLTTFFAALFLFWLGSGPVRGFGITLGLGLATTMFTALLVTRMLMTIWIVIKKPKTIDL
ncbi:MAG: protein translocase subunit SecD [Alphaproteobacteria bacterium]|nr:protein translocase subunit SecD [Alphaproteobacteria bacterium]